MSLKVEIARVLNSDVERRWLDKWVSWPTGHVFNHPNWLGVVQEALPDRCSMAISVTSANRSVLFMSAEESNGGLHLAGSPYMDKGSILWDPELSSEEWNQFMLILLEKFDWLCFQEISPIPSWTAGPILQQIWTTRKRSSANPWFFVDAPRISAKQCHELRRFTRLLEKQGTVKFSFRQLSTADLEIMQDIEQGSTKAERHKAILTGPTYQNWIRAFLEYFRDGCWIALLSLNGRPIAHYAGVSYKSRLLGLHMAFLKDYARFSPGNVLVFNILPLLRECGIKEFDYGRGQSVMKARFARDNDAPQWTLYYFNKNRCGLLARMRVETVWGCITAGRLLRRMAAPYLNSVLDRLSPRR